MRRQFILSITEDTPSVVNKMVERLTALNVGWCHYTKGLWLVVDAAGNVTAEKLRIEIRAAFPNAHLMVFDVPAGGTWSGWAPAKMGPWLDSNWK